MFDLNDRMKRLFGDDWKPQPKPLTISNVAVVEDMGDHIVVTPRFGGQSQFKGLFSEDQIGDEDNV